MTSLPSARAKQIQDAVFHALSNHHADLARDLTLRFIKITVRLDPRTGEVTGVSVTKETEEKISE